MGGTIYVACILMGWRVFHRTVPYEERERDGEGNRERREGGSRIVYSAMQFIFRDTISTFKSVAKLRKVDLS